jgi:hypothetical protein
MRGLKLTKGRFEGTIDVILEATRDIEFENGLKLKTGDRICVDIKFSGLLEDRWSVHGWQWTTDQRNYHGKQAKQYHYLSSLPFFFLVVDPGGKYIKWFHIIMNEDVINAHLEKSNAELEQVMLIESLQAWEPRPDIMSCDVCALRNECKHKHDFPHPIDIDLTV